MSQQDSDGTKLPSADGEIGYCKPPMQRRFKDSGNPKGRPKGAKNRKTIVHDVTTEMHNVTENGVRQRRSTLELVLLRLRNMALEGKKPQAFDELHRLIKTYQPQDPDNKLGCLVVPAPKTPEEAIAEGEKANAEARARRAAQSMDHT